MNSEEALGFIESRRSIRSYKQDAVPEDLIRQIVEAGTYAATGRGLQSPIIIAVTDREARDRLSKLNADILGTDADPFYGAPVVLIVLGLGSCWIHRAKEEFDSPEGKRILRDLGIEGDYEGIGHCIIGYIDGEVPGAKPRKDGWAYWI